MEDSSQVTKSYSERMKSLMADPDVEFINTKFTPYFELHKITDMFDVCEVMQAQSGASAGKLVWRTDHDLPIELKKDIIKLFRRHFASE
jgi:hypothetical protein